MMYHGSNIIKWEDLTWDWSTDGRSDWKYLVTQADHNDAIIILKVFTWSLMTSTKNIVTYILYHMVCVKYQFT